MPISIITRAYKSSELANLSRILSQIHGAEFEVIAVCNKKDYEINSFTILEKDVGRFEAKVEGIKLANFDHILFIDSDQYPENGLLKELESIKNNMVIIPEKSSNHGIIGTSLDDFRFRNEKRALLDPTPLKPVIPRYYRTDQLIEASNSIPKSVFNITNHEDSILYNEVYKLSRDIAFSNLKLVNNDPNFLSLLIKAYLYGKATKFKSSTDVPQEISGLCHYLDKNSLNLWEIGFGPGYLLQLARAFAYQLGVILG